MERGVEQLKAVINQGLKPLVSVGQHGCGFNISDRKIEPQPEIWESQESWGVRWLTGT